MIELMVVDDHTMMRDFLIEKLSDTGHFSQCYGAVDGSQAMQMAQTKKPDVILMDISLPGIDGIETARAILNKQPNIAIVCLTMHLDIQILKRAIAVPVNAYVVKDDPFEVLLTAILKSADGGRYLSPKLRLNDDGILTWQNCVKQQPDDKPHKLTKRELQVIKRVASGLSTKQIARELSISERTVDAHRSHIIHKTGLKNVAELTAYAIKHQFI